MNYKIGTLKYAVSNLAGRGPPGRQKRPFLTQTITAPKTFNKIYHSAILFLILYYNRAKLRHNGVFLEQTVYAAEVPKQYIPQSLSAV